jgi:hypothetical protein
MAAARSVDRTRITVMSVVAFVVLFMAWLVFHSNFMVGRALLLAFPGWDVEYRGALPHFTGKVVAKHVVMVPMDGEREEAVSFERVEVDVPAWQWYRSAFGELLARLFRTRLFGGAPEAAIRNVRIVLAGGDGVGGVGYSNELALVGQFSGSPFEAEGCRQDAFWTREELGLLGLNVGPTRMSIEINDLGGQRETIQRIETAGAGRAEHRGLVATPDGAGVFALEHGPRDAFAADAWLFEDDGFIAARNRYCAAEAGIDEAEFVRWHLLAVERTMAMLGLAPNAALAAEYRRFAAEGGRMAYALSYTPAIPVQQLGVGDFATWLPRMRGSFGERPQEGTGLVAIEPRPFPEEGEWETTYELLAFEGALRAPLRPPAGAVDAAAAPQAVRVQRVAAGSVAAAAVPARPRLDYAATLEQVGERVWLFTTNSKPRLVEVVEGPAGRLQVRWRIPGGSYEYQVAAERFVRAEPVR